MFVCLFVCVYHLFCQWNKERNQTERVEKILDWWCTTLCIIQYLLLIWFCLLMTHYGYKYNYTHNTFLKSHVIFLNVFFATQYVFVHKKNLLYLLGSKGCFVSSSAWNTFCSLLCLYFTSHPKLWTFTMIKSSYFKWT